MAHVQPMTDAGVLVTAIVAMKGGGFYVSGSYPASMGVLGGGLFHGEFAATVEEAVEHWLIWFDEQWSGL